MKSPVPAMLLGLVAVGLGVTAWVVFLVRRGDEEVRRQTMVREVEAARAHAQASQVETVQSLQAELANERAKRAELESRLATLESPKPVPRAPAEAPQPAPVAAAEPEKKKGLQVGQELSPEAIADLGLDEGQVAAANRILQDEERRLVERMGRFYMENVSADDGATAGKGAKELLVLMFPQLSKDIAALEKLPEETRADLEQNKASIEAVLPPDSFLGRLAGEMHSARQDTYSELGRFLSPEQVKGLQDRWLPEGAFHWAGGVNMDMGPAPEGLKK